MPALLGDYSGTAGGLPGSRRAEPPSSCRASPVIAYPHASSRILSQRGFAPHVGCAIVAGRAGNSIELYRGIDGTRGCGPDAPRPHRGRAESDLVLAKCCGGDTFVISAS